MNKLYVCLFATLATSAFAGITVTSPSNGAQVTSPVHYVATAQSPDCSKGVAAMGIYTAPYVLAYSVNGSKLDTYLTLSAGTYNTVVQEWDNCGWSASVPITITVGSGGGGGGTFSNLESSQAVEFDINQFFSGMSFIWGHECRIAGGHEWDTWDNINMHWVPSGIACNPLSNAWNHLVIQAQRTSDNRLLFKSITLNGKTNTLNRYDNPSPTTWYGLTINYQMDGNSQQQPYSVHLDKLNFTYE